MNRQNEKKYLNNRSAFVCYRKYELIIIVSIVSNRSYKNNEKSDLFILNKLSVINNINFELLKSLFSHIYMFSDDFSNNLSSALIRTIYHVIPSCFVNKAVLDSEKIIKNVYSQIYMSGWFPLQTYLCEMNPTSKKIMFEDGISSYNGYINEEQDSCKKKLSSILLYRILKKGRLSISISEMIVYRPEMVCNPISKNIQKLPSVKDDTFSLLSHIFNYESGKSYQNIDIIYFDQIGIGYDEKKIKNDFVEYVSQTDFKYKVRSHPMQNHDASNSSDEESQMWELMAREINSSIILVSVWSTSVFTPSFLFEKKNPVVLLYQICLKKTDPLFIMMESFIKLYRDKISQNIFTPSSMEEAVKVLNKLKSRSIFPEAT